jgi:lysophospholipase L1-like esterase
MPTADPTSAPMTDPAPASRLSARRVAAWLALSALTLAAAEATVRTVDLGRLEPPELLDARRQRIAELSEITGVFGDERDATPAGSLTQVPPSTVSYGWYDRPRWDYFDALGCVEYRFNSLGFRDEELPLAKPPDETRMIAVGDSLTFACGVPLEDCWVQRLEAKLEAANGSPVEVVNAGLARGHQPESYAGWLEAEGMRLDPDAVLLGFCLNDISESIPLYLPLEVAAEPWLGGASRFLVELQRRIDPPSAAAPPVVRANRVLKKNAAQWRATQDGIRRLHELIEARGGRLIVAILPMLSQLGAGYPFRELHELVARFCADEGIECIDVLPALEGLDEREIWVHPTDQHANDAGQERIAAAIAEWFADRPLGPRVRTGSR